MRSLTLFLLLFSLTAFAQKSEVFRIDNLPKQGIVLDKGWKWQVGDNPEWAKPEFDDAGWEEMNNLLVLVDSLPQNPKLTGIRWFRLKLQFDRSLSKDILALAIVQSGASEIYLNGKLVETYGVVSSNPDKMKAYDPMSDPIPFSISKDSIVVLTVRYTFQYNVHQYVMGQPNPVGPKITLNTLKAVQSSKMLLKTHLYNSNVFRIGAFFILFISYFALYLYSPVQKANLFFCLFSLSILGADLIQLYIYDYHWIVEISFLTMLFHFLLIVGKILLLTAVYLLMNQKTNWFYWLLPGLILLCFLSGWFLFSFFIDVFIIYHPLLILLIIHIFPNLINLEIIRITVKSIQNRKKGAWIIALGGMVFLISVVVFILSIRLNFIDTPVLGSIQTIGDLVYNVSWLSIPLAVSIYTGLDIALINRSLKEKLVEVEQLSLEKQQILAAQNETLERQVAERTAELNQSLETLKSTQAQLIQSEKLASLGELTAGIAHEIQNPLNFVNNFAEVSAEMLDEMHEELEKGDTTEAIAIATDLKTNLEKINHHGQRASSIVKGMLEHSRASTGVKEPTDLNALADEYLRLAYHGLRAKDNNFNATMDTHFDPDLPLVSVIPQDIGRVLLNLINNAFYAVNQRAATVETLHATSLQQQPPYQPTVTISTQKTADQIIIKIQDNGPGIPEAIRDKIFQPFFTTKPTGQGTGLGLSLAYDIVTKGHGGHLEVETKENEGTEFTIILPVKTL